MNKCGFLKKGNVVFPFFVVFLGSKHKLHFQVLSKIFSGVSTNYLSGANTNCLFRCKVRIAFSCANINYIFRY